VTQLTFCYNALSDELMKLWRNQKGEYPIKLTDEFKDEMHGDFATNNIFDVFTHFYNQSEVSAIATGETATDYVWCVYRGYAWLTLVIQFSSPEYDSERYVFDMHSRFDSKFIELVDKLAGESDDQR
jgi:hypothetical protein